MGHSMKLMAEVLAEIYPNTQKPMIAFSSIPRDAGEAAFQVLEQAGDDLTHENIMRQATNLKNVELDMALPGIKGNTAPNDYRVNKQFQMAKFDGEKWERFGDIVTDQGKE